tara:strand:- start:138 stop:530 length:393 start_codon:yes stop_codon:yes gene_type:complete
MKLLATMRHVFKLALRLLEGFINSLFDLMGVDLKTPELSRLSRRLSSLAYSKPKEISHTVIDSSALKVLGKKRVIFPSPNKHQFGKQLSSFYSVPRDRVIHVTAPQLAAEFFCFRVFTAKHPFLNRKSLS